MAASVTDDALVIHPLTGKLFVDRDLLTFCATPPRVSRSHYHSIFGKCASVGWCSEVSFWDGRPKSQRIQILKSRQSKLPFLSVHAFVIGISLLSPLSEPKRTHSSLGARRVPGFRFCRSHWPRSRRFIFRRNLSGLQSSATSFSSPIAPSQREGEGERQMDINVGNVSALNGRPP